MSDKQESETVGLENPSGYGEKGVTYNIGEVTLQIDDEFMVATLLAIVAVINQMIPEFDDIVSQVGANIYDQIKKQDS